MLRNGILFYEDIKNTKNIKILEFGVREEIQLNFFELCEKIMENYISGY